MLIVTYIELGVKDGSALKRVCSTKQLDGIGNGNKVTYDFLSPW